MRFLHAVHFDYDKCMKQQSENVAFLEKLPILNQLDAKVFELLVKTSQQSNGSFYALGRDHGFRPILCLKIKEMRFGSIDIELLKRTLVVVSEHCINNLFIPGQIENWCIIVDLKGLGLTDIPVKVVAYNQKMQEAIGYLQSCYRSRAYRIYVMNTPWLVSKILWPLAQLVLDQNTIDKVNIASGARHENMLKHINPNNLEQKFGGNVPDVVSDFW